MNTRDALILLIEILLQSDELLDSTKHDLGRLHDHMCGVEKKEEESGL